RGWGPATNKKTRRIGAGPLSQRGVRCGRRVVRDEGGVSVTTFIEERLGADRQHLLHPLHHPSAHLAPQIWVKGRGAIVTDAAGKEYIDGLSGLWNVNVGHGRTELADAAREQMAALAYHS